MYSSFAQFSGRARIDDGQWFRFGPSPLDKRTIEWTPESRFITRQEWEEVCDHVRSGRNPPLAATILATAEYLAAKGHSRSAITEAITALEVALFEFASDPKVDSVLAPKLRDRLDLNTLKTQVEKFGLTRSISYLVPILIPEAVIPQPILKGCQKAIAIRQNVVHNGQREVPERLLKSSLRAVRQMCELFATLTEDPDLAAAKEP